MSNGIRSTFFAIVLYDDDPLHRDVMKYIISCPLWLDYYVYICHDKDIAEIRYSKSEEEPDLLLPIPREKKRHYHVLLKLQCRTHLSAFLSLFSVREDKRAVQYALAVVNPYAYVTYMLHMDFKSLHDDKKKQYKMTDLVCSVGAEAILDRQNANFVQYFFDIIDKLGDGMDIFSVCDYVRNNFAPTDAQEYLRIIRGFQYLFVQRGGALASSKKYKQDGG